MIERQTNDMAALMEEGNMLLGYKSWSEAGKRFDQVLELFPESAQAYIGKLCVQLKVSHEENLVNCGQLLDSLEHFQSALNVADKRYREKILYYNRCIYEELLEIEQGRLARNQAIKERNIGRGLYTKWMGGRSMCIAFMIVLSPILGFFSIIMILHSPDIRRALANVDPATAWAVPTMIWCGLFMWGFSICSNRSKSIRAKYELDRYIKGDKKDKRAIYNREQLECRCGNLYDDDAETCNACGISTAEEGERA